MVKITKAGARQIIKSQHNGGVSAKAVDLIKEVGIEHAEKVSAFASKLAAHANRKTLRPEDIKLAIKNI